MVRGAVAIGLWVILGWGVAGAADWSQWRGSARDGRIAEDQLPRQWPEKLKRLWQVEVGVGHSSPLVVNGGIYLHSRQGDQEVVRRLDPKDGSTVWEDRIATPYTVHSSALAHGKGPKSTPIAHQGRLFTLGISGRVVGFSSWRAANYSGGTISPRNLPKPHRFSVWPCPRWSRPVC